MWTDENRARYDRSKLRYPSDLTDQEWSLIEPLIPPAKRGGNRRTVVVRDVVDGVMYILSTGCQWLALPKDLPPRSTVNDYFRRWDDDGTHDRIHSLVDTAIGRDKHIIGSKLRARSNDGQAGEAAITVQVLNRMIRIAKPISIRLA